MKIKIIIMGIALVTGVFGLDPRTPEGFREGRIHELRTRYSGVTGNEPSMYNLFKSLELKNPEQAQQTELITAIDLVGLIAPEPRAAERKLVRCFEQNEFWLVKDKCIEALLAFDRKKAVELGKLLLADPSIELDGKISLAKMMVRKGELWGYGVLNEGLNTNDANVRKRAQDLLDAFRAHDGQVWNSAGDKINIKALMEEVDKR